MLNETSDIGLEINRHSDKKKKKKEIKKEKKNHKNKTCSGQRHKQCQIFYRLIAQKERLHSDDRWQTFSLRMRAVTAHVFHHSPSVSVAEHDTNNIISQHSDPNQ